MPGKPLYVMDLLTQIFQQAVVSSYFIIAILKYLGFLFQADLYLH